FSLHDALPIYRHRRVRFQVSFPHLYCLLWFHRSFRILQCSDLQERFLFRLLARCRTLRESKRPSRSKRLPAKIYFSWIFLLVDREISESLTHKNVKAPEKLQCPLGQSKYRVDFTDSLHIKRTTL